MTIEHDQQPGTEHPPRSDNQVVGFEHLIATAWLSPSEVDLRHVPSFRRSDMIPAEPPHRLKSSRTLETLDVLVMRRDSLTRRGGHDGPCSDKGEANDLSMTNFLADRVSATFAKKEPGHR